LKGRIFLIGFMGTGKTTVGHRLAERLGWSLHDSDEEIVRREGRTISEIFAAEGEPYFRQRESEMLAELSARDRAVITTGGGAVLAESNRDLLRRSGLVVALEATVDEIVRRVSADENRPLLQAEASERRQRVEQLMAARKGLYDFAELRVNTTAREVESIVDEVMHYLSLRQP
jgi:shikimate kinase